MYSDWVWGVKEKNKLFSKHVWTIFLFSFASECLTLRITWSLRRNFFYSRVRRKKLLTLSKSLNRGKEEEEEVSNALNRPLVAPLLNSHKETIGRRREDVKANWLLRTLPPSEQQIEWCKETFGHCANKLTPFRGWITFLTQFTTSLNLFHLVRVRFTTNFFSTKETRKTREK